MLETVREVLARDPFVPVQFVMASGDRITVENPSLLALGKDHATYYFPRSDGFVHFRLNQIVLVQTVSVVN